MPSGAEQIEYTAGDVADERGLQGGGAKRVEPEHLERLAAPGQGGLELEDGTCCADRRIACELGEQPLREALARTAHHDVGFAHEALGRQAELVQSGRVDQIHRGAERDPERDGEHRDRQARRLLAQLRQQQDAPDRERPAGLRRAIQTAGTKGLSPCTSRIRMRSAVSAAVRECVIKIPAPAFALT